MDRNERAQQLLVICSDVRSRLVNNHRVALGLFPIEELVDEMTVADTTVGSHYLGMTEIYSDLWECVASRKIQASLNTVERVLVRLFDEEDHSLPLEIIIFTLLHEFAHCLTPSTMIKGGSREGKGKRTRAWHCQEHCDVFYEIFGQLLLLAERERILVLSATRFKFSPVHLKRLDDLDLLAGTFTIGSCPLYQSVCEQEKDIPFRFVIQSSAGREKLLIVDKKAELTRTTFVKLAARKLNLRKASRIFRKDGSELMTDAELHSVESGDVVIIR